MAATRTTQESFQQSLVEIGSVVSEEKIFFKFHLPFFLICIIGQNRQKFKVHKKSLSKMTANTKNRIFFKLPKLRYVKPESAQI
jgi:hypothetical protein